MLFDVATSNNLYIISDEAYSDFTLRKSFISVGAFDKEKERVVIVNSLSKNLGISGWRIGYAITNERILGLMFNLNQHLISCPATILEYYVVKHFDELVAITRPQIAALLVVRKETENFMKEVGLDCLPGSGTFYFFVSIAGSGLRSEEFVLRLLEEYGVATVPGVGYGKSCDQFIRVSIGTEPADRIKKGLLAVRELISKTKTAA